jgi:putative glutamine amidotransferase
MRKKAKGSSPWIGMPMQMNPDDEKQYLSRMYSDAVAAAGGLPIMIPLFGSAGHMDPLIGHLDGLLLPGNDSDLDPSLYGVSRQDVCGPAQKLRDGTDFYLLKSAMKRKIPILAICFGIQSLNVFLGGSLIQDIPTSVGNSIQHSNRRGKDPRHKIRISSGSVLEQLAGGLEATVNSTHHQAVDCLGRRLKVIAQAPDGVIESIFGTEPQHWILGVQWHPEKEFCSDDFSRRLFEHFLAHCRAARGSDEGAHS